MTQPYPHDEEPTRVVVAGPLPEDATVIVYEPHAEHGADLPIGVPSDEDTTQIVLAAHDPAPEDATQVVLAPKHPVLPGAVAAEDATQIVITAVEDASPILEVHAEDVTRIVVAAEQPDPHAPEPSQSEWPARDDPTDVRMRGDDSWFEDRLKGFVDALRHKEDGAARSEADLRVLASTARDMLDRLTADPAQRPAAPWADAVLQPGQILANTFVVKELIARGGMGEIYRVRHRDLQSEFAVKILQPRFVLDAKIVALLLDEARFLQQVDNDAVVTCHGLLRDTDGRILLLMEFLRGNTLAQRLGQSPLPVDQIQAVARRMAEALGAIHAQRIVHQDVAPDNIVLCNGSCYEAKIVDFGVARSLADGQSAHDSIDFAGKYSWMSPEQLTPGAAVGPASDFYSLGLVLAAAARGRRLEMGTDAESARAARRATPALEDMPDTLRPMLEALLTPNLDRRIGTAKALVAAIAPERKSWFRRRR